MNTRLLYFLLIVQFAFAGALVFVGMRVRENRRQDYLQWTHRATSGRASQADFEKLAAFIPERAERTEIRALFGLPLVRVNRIEFDEGGKNSEFKGEAWLYYFAPAIADPEHPPAPMDIGDAEKLRGLQKCFVVTFDERGRAAARVASVMHPLAPNTPPLKP